MLAVPWWWRPRCGTDALVRAKFVSGPQELEYVPGRSNVKATPWNLGPRCCAGASTRRFSPRFHRSLARCVGHTLASGHIPWLWIRNHGVRSEPSHKRKHHASAESSLGSESTRTAHDYLPSNREVGSHFDVVPADPEVWSKDCDGHWQGASEIPFGVRLCHWSYSLQLHFCTDFFSERTPSSSRWRATSFSAEEPPTA